jgi:hypothetical protein
VIQVSKLNKSTFQQSSLGELERLKGEITGKKQSETSSHREVRLQNREETLKGEKRKQVQEKNLVNYLLNKD